MSVFHDEVEIEDFEYDSETESYYYPCPCGDQFRISVVRFVVVRANKGVTNTHAHTYTHIQTHTHTHTPHHPQQEDLENGESVAQCPSCSLIVKVIYNLVSVA